MFSDTTNQPSFRELELDKRILKTLEESGYKVPSPIQAEMIPRFLAGKDVIGQAQTGTGKTAAFALPILQKVVPGAAKPQALVLAPTRELAIQVSEAFMKYASGLEGVRIIPVYGGADYSGQIRKLKRGVHVVVGTPGRVIDHINRGTLDISELKYLVLDEADEMLKMGFIEDVEWVLAQTPDTRQVALFSATLPEQVRRLARKYMDSPDEVTIESRTTTVENTRQRYWMVQGINKLDALSRILERDDYDSVIIFVRTKMATIELSESLNARGFEAAAINGDIPQNQRERIINQLRSGRVKILVATDVAARGLDVDCITHVINYDIPFDTESYIHRIGRTGRAGRKGEAILFLSPRQRRLLYEIEDSTNQEIEPMDIPTVSEINDIRVERFKQKIKDTLLKGGIEFNTRLVEMFHQETEVPLLDVAAALATMAQGDSMFLLKEKPIREKKNREDRKRDRNRSEGRRREIVELSDEEGMATFRVEVGHADGVRPGNIVGAIAGETGIKSSSIGRINIFHEFSTVDLPQDISDKKLTRLKRAKIVGCELQISKVEEAFELEENRSRRSSENKRSDNRRSDRRDRRPGRSRDKRGGSERHAEGGLSYRKKGRRSGEESRNKNRDKNRRRRR